MAKLFDINEKEWKKWVKSRPEIVRAIAEKLPPNRLYRLTTTDQRVTMVSYSEDGTVTVDVSSQFNAFTLHRQVFGIDPNTLVECDLPSESEREEIDALSMTIVSVEPVEALH